MQAGTTAMMMARQNTGGVFPGPITLVSANVATSVTPTANRLQLVAVHLQRAGSQPVPPTSITGCGLTFAQVAGGDTRASGASRGGCYLFRAQNASTSNGTLTLNGGTFDSLQGNGFTWVEITSARIGNNGADAIVQAKTSASYTATTGSATFNSAFGSATNATLVVATSFQGNVSGCDIDAPVVDVAGSAWGCVAGFYQGEDATFSAAYSGTVNGNIMGLEITS